MLSIAVCDDILLECTQLAKQIRHIAKKAGWEVFASGILYRGGTFKVHCVI